MNLRALSGLVTRRELAGSPPEVPALEDLPSALWTFVLKIIRIAESCLKQLSA